MARPPKDKGEKVNWQTMVRLPEEQGEEFEQLAKERGAPPAVLARMIVLEWIREQKQGQEREQ
jgi:predicted DNA-binding protein